MPKKGSTHTLALNISYCCFCLSVVVVMVIILVAGFQFYMVSLAAFYFTISHFLNQYFLFAINMMLLQL